MIVRRITAGAAAVALAGTAFAAAPAMAKTNTTTLKLDAKLASALQATGASVSAVKPAKLKGTTLSFPAKLKGSTVTHKGGFSITPGTGGAPLTLANLAINSKNGKVTATATSPLPNPLVLEDVLIIKGGKNKIKKTGKWTNGTLRLAKSFMFGGQPTDPATVLGPIVGIDVATGQALGKISVIVKK
jgi:hypothetical protein